MTERERWLETLLFGKPDRVPFSPGGPRESTLAAWRTQGLPEGVDWFTALREELRLEPPPTIDRTHPWVETRMIPMFEEKIIERRERTLIVQDWKGNICEISDKYDTRYLRDAIDFVTRRWIKCPVETRADWEAMKPRYNPVDPARFPPDFERQAQRIRERKHVVTFSITGPWWQLREWCGFEGLCMLMLDDPEFVREMVAFWRDFVSAVLDKYLRHVTPDCFAPSEDMAYKHKAMISPGMTREFLLPCWRQWCDQVKAAGVPAINMDSDGYIGELIPLWIEAGINVCNPIEVAAGNDLNEFRRTFGRKIGYVGGVDKRAMAKGGAVLRAEMERLAPVVRDGGYLPSCDHGIPGDVSWPNMIEYSRLLARLTGWL